MSRHTHRPSWLFASIVLIVLAAFLCIGQLNAACTEEAHCSVLRNRITYPAIMQGNDAAPVQFFNAPVNTGMGAFTITQTLSLSIPASTPASSLKSTLTLTITSGS